MIQYLLHDYLPAFATAVVAEIGVAVLFGLWSLWQLGAIVLINAATHPALHVVLWAGFWWHDRPAPLLMILALEMVVVGVEGMLLRRWLRMPAKRAFSLSLGMNAVSYLIGLAVTF